MKNRPYFALGHARTNGYAGQWPPKPEPTIKSANQFVSTLARVEHGEHRAVLLYRLGRAALAFYDQLEPERYRRLAEQLVSIAHDSKNTKPRVRLRAIEAATRPVVDGLRLLTKNVRHGREPAALERLYECMAAFYGEVEPEIAFLAAELDRLAEARDLTGVRAAELSLKLVVELADVLRARQQKQDEIEQVARSDGPVSPVLEEMKREIRAELEAEQRPHKTSAQISAEVARLNAENAARSAALGLASTHASTLEEAQLDSQLISEIAAERQAKLKRS